MNLSVELRLREELIVAFHEQSPCFFVKGTFWEWNYEKTLDNLENMGEGPLSWVPVSLQRIDANLTGGRGDIGMEYFC